MSVNIYKQLAAIAGYTVELADRTNLYTVIEDDYKLGELGGYLIDIITGTFGRDNRMPIYYALQNLSLVEVTPYVNYIMTPWYKNRYSTYSENTDDFFMLYGAVILVELDDDGEETAIAHIFKERTASGSGDATTNANTYAKAHTDKRFSMYMVQWNDNNTSTSMAGSAFYQCSTIVHAYIFINGLTAITYRDFRECSNLETVDIFGAGSVNIYDQAFYNCQKLKRFHIEGRINRVGEWAFRYCQSLTQFDIVTTYSLPLFTIESYAFNGCLALQELPDKFWSSVQYIRSHAFEDCHSLTKVGAMPNVRAIEDSAFYRNVKLRTVGESNVSSGAAKFNLGARAFNGCISLENVYRLDTVEKIGLKAFNGCIRLKSMGLKSGVWQGILNSSYPLSNDHLISLTDISFVYGCTTPFASMLSKTGVKTINASLPYLTQSMFNNCYHLESVALSSSITGIPTSCFANCFRLTSATLSNSITTIGQSAFYNDYNLSSINLPQGLTTIGTEAFRNCYSLDEVVIPASVTSIGTNAFQLATDSGYSYWYPPMRLTRIFIKGKHEGDISGAPWGAPSSVKIVWEADI